MNWIACFAYFIEKEQRTTLQIKQLAGNKKYNTFQNHMKCLNITILVNRVMCFVSITIYTIYMDILIIIALQPMRAQDRMSLCTIFLEELHSDIDFFFLRIS